MPPDALPFPPMEADLVRELPTGGGWQYEPKWDGFRGVVENVAGPVSVWSRNARPLLRYFPELEALGERLPPGSALDGEIVVEREGALDFDALQTRLHPAESRVRRLSAEIPARFVCFDMLLWESGEVWRLPLEERRARVEALPFDVSPATQDIAVAQGWIERLDVAGFDGVVAKRLGLAYLPGSREAVVKVKRELTADCVVAGVRWGDQNRLKTLLLGLYSPEGELWYVGSAAVAPKREAEIAGLVEPLLAGAPARGFSEPSRWGTPEREEAAIRPELVVEVRYDKWQGRRFRHGTKLLRFRDDKEPKACTVAQVRPRPAAGDPTVGGLLAR